MYKRASTRQMCKPNVWNCFHCKRLMSSCSGDVEPQKLVCTQQRWKPEAHETNCCFLAAAGAQPGVAPPLPPSKLTPCSLHYKGLEAKGAVLELHFWCACFFSLLDLCHVFFPSLLSCLHFLFPKRYKEKSGSGHLGEENWMKTEWNSLYLKWK